MIQLNEDQWKEIVALQDGDSNQPPAGGYAMVIRDYVDSPDREYLELLKTEPTLYAVTPDNGFSRIRESR